jgi:hypothetical protein
VLLWPTAVVHAILSILLGRAWLVAEAASKLPSASSAGLVFFDLKGS